MFLSKRSYLFQEAELPNSTIRDQRHHPDLAHQYNQYNLMEFKRHTNKILGSDVELLNLRLEVLYEGSSTQLSADSKSVLKLMVNC